MALSVEDRRVGDVTVVTCRGRLIAGAESAGLQQRLDALIAANPQIVLHLGGVEFIDSGGLGLLVRCLMRARNAHGDLKVCAVSSKINEVLRIARLASFFHAYDTEADAIADAHQSTRAPDVSFLNPNVLCVDPSPDVLAYLRELLKEAGYRVVTAGNLPDALVLLRATRAAVVVIGAELRAARTRTADDFQKLADASAVVELPADFAGQDAAHAAEQLVAAVHRCTQSKQARSNN